MLVWVSSRLTAKNSWASAPSVSLVVVTRLGIKDGQFSHGLDLIFWVRWVLLSREKEYRMQSQLAQNAQRSERDAYRFRGGLRRLPWKLLSNQ